VSIITETHPDSAPNDEETAISVRARTLVTIATYNEIENLPPLVDEILRRHLDFDILVIDDNSPDGTGRWCKRRAAADPQVHCLHRPGKLGLGSATVAAMQTAIEKGYRYVLNMDADFSHHPRHIAALMEELTAEPGGPDVVIGSRYVAGGGVEGWPWRRRLMSRLVNFYARVMLGLRVRDCSGAFRAFRTEALSRLDFDRIRARGYAFEEELLWRLKRAGAEMTEVPITFADRLHGESKINPREALTALWVIFRLGVKNWLGV